MFTLGRRRDSADNVLAPGDVPVVEIERGGDVTYHGPGQLVGYPIRRARATDERDLHRYLRKLEDALIRRPRATSGPRAGARPAGPAPGWRAQEARSIGIACRRWVTFHGFALNVATDLGRFARINPCGFEAAVMTSLAVETGRPLTLADVKPLAIAQLGAGSAATSPSARLR